MIRTRRRIAVAFAAIAGALLLLHEQYATLLVTRGDGELARGLPRSARVFYTRAALLSRLPLASERIAFTDLEIGDRPSLNHAMRISEQALRTAPDFAPLLIDRGLCAQRLGDDDAAAAAYGRAAILLHDPRLFSLAARAAFRRGHIREAHEDWLAASRIDSALITRLRAVRKASRA